MVVGSGVGFGVVLTGPLVAFVLVGAAVVVGVVVVEVVVVGATVVVVVVAGTSTATVVVVVVVVTGAVVVVVVTGGATVVVVVVVAGIVTTSRLAGKVIVATWDVSIVEPVRVVSTCRVRGRKSSGEKIVMNIDLLVLSDNRGDLDDHGCEQLDVLLDADDLGRGASCHGLLDNDRRLQHDLLALPDQAAGQVELVHGLHLLDVGCTRDNLMIIKS